MTPSIVWTDDIGTATLVCLGLTFNNWTPDANFVGESVVPIGDNTTYAFAYRDDDMIAAFDIANIANTELKLAMRLKSWLVRGGTITINTEDSEGRVYTSKVAPGTVPSLKMTDIVELEYTLSVVVVNNVNEHMLYTPIAYRRPGGIALSPSPASLVLGALPVSVTATLTDSAGSPIAGATVIASSSNTARFTVSPSSATTDAGGHAAFSLTPIASGSATLEVASGAVSAIDAVTVGAYGIPFTPIAWWKRDTLTSLANLDPVTAQSDSSPSGWGLTVEGSNAPMWDATTMGGSVKFDQTLTEALKNLTFNSLATATELTIFVAARATAGGLFSCGDEATSVAYLLYGYMASGFFQFADGALAWRAKYSFTPSATDHIFETVYDGAGSGNSGKVQQYLEGTLQSPTFDGTVPAALSLGGAGIAIGRIFGASWLTGNLAEILIFGTSLSADDRATVRAALGAKYGITVV